MPPERRSAHALRLTVGLAISAVLVWFAFRHTDLASLWSALGRVSVFPMILAVVLATLPFPLRIPRWQLLLQTDDAAGGGDGGSSGSPPRPPFPPPRPLWQAIAIGFAANNVLPLRAGEVLRIGAGSRLARWPLGAVLSSVAIERVLDALTVVALLGVGLLAANLPADLRLGGGPELAPLARRTGLIGLGALAIALIAAWRRVAAVALLRRILPSGRVSDRIARFSDETLHGLTAMHSWRRAIPALLWSVVIWLVNAAALWTAFTAFHFTVPWSGALIVQGALMLAIAVPSSPSYIGVFEAVIPLALSIYGIDHTAALACALLYHVATFIPITVLGAIAAVRTGTTLRASAAV